MKACPKCSRVYADDSLNFCLDDGEWLTKDESVVEPPTAILTGDSAALTPDQTWDGAETTRTKTATLNPDRSTTGIDRYKTAAVVVAATLAAIALIFGGIKFFDSHQ